MKRIVNSNKSIQFLAAYTSSKVRKTD